MTVSTATCSVPSRPFPWRTQNFIRALECGVEDVSRVSSIQTGPSFQIPPCFRIRTVVQPVIGRLAHHRLANGVRKGLLVPEKGCSSKAPVTLSLCSILLLSAHRGRKAGKGTSATSSVPIGLINEGQIAPRRKVEKRHCSRHRNKLQRHLWILT